MISFEKVNQFDPLYQFLNEYFRQTHNRLYYRKIQVVGYENVPPKGYPVFVIANHQNAVMDPLGILYFFKDRRQPVYIARGDVFKGSGFVARLLRFLKILPTFRSRDGGREDIKSNLFTFDLAARFLNEGTTLCMFPEAGHQHGHYLSTFKKGFPRIAFLAAEKSGFTLDFKILPIFFYYSDLYNMGAKQLMVVGKPFAISEFYDLYKAEPNKAYIAMNAKAREALCSLGVDITDHDRCPQYDTVCLAARKSIVEQNGWNAAEPYSDLRSDQVVVSRLQKMDEEAHERFEELMEKAAEYKEKLQQLKLRDWLFDEKPTTAKILGVFALLLLTFPLFLFGMVNNIIPFKTPELLKRKTKDPLFASTLNFCVGVILAFPVWYLLLFILVWCLSKWWIALLYMLAVALTLPCYFYWKKNFVKWLGRCRFHRYERRRTPAFVRLKELRAAMRQAVCDETSNQSCNI